MKLPGWSLVAIALASPVAVSARVAPVDRMFLEKTSQGADFEIALARMAVAGATHPEVRAYAQRIVKDHEQANTVLRQLLKAEGVAVPARMTAPDIARLSQLKSLKGAAFDKRYIAEVTRINMADEQDSAKESRMTKDAQIKAYLKRFSQMDAEHKRMGDQLKTTVG